MGTFERYLTLWVLLGMAAGVLLGSALPAFFEAVSTWQLYRINLPVAVLVWLMILPMMASIDFSSVGSFTGYGRGVLVTSFMNYAVKPFSMALLAWLFFQHLFAPWLTAEQADMFAAGAILLGAAPCTAMVFVWSYLSDGDPNYTLVQVSVNDLLMLLFFVPIVTLLMGVTGIPIPYGTLLTSLGLFVALPLVAGFAANKLLIARFGARWYQQRFLPALKPLSIGALLLTLVLLFALQGQALLRQPLIILMIAVPLTLQTYLIFFLTWGLARLARLPYAQCAPGALIGASNFFELAVAVAIALFGLTSGAALATVVGVLIEVPVMLSLVRIARAWRSDGHRG
jgi:ACR3 family arsenite transporter